MPNSQSASSAATPTPGERGGDDGDGEGDGDNGEGEGAEESEASGQDQAKRDKEAWRELAGEGESWFDVIKRQEDERKAEEERCVPCSRRAACLLCRRLSGVAALLTALDCLWAPSPSRPSQAQARGAGAHRRRGASQERRD